VENLCNIGMLGTQHLLVNGQRSLEQWFCLRVRSLIKVQQSYVAEHRGDVWMGWAQRFLTNRES
jgi:hypothetical protein